jgi:flagellar basal-body rod protein FlgF
VSGTLEMISAAMHADADAVRTIGNNIANADSVAYRRQIPVARMTFSEVADENATATQAVHTEISVDPHLGELKSTGEPMNLAIEGSGFFVVSTANGEAFTRRGDLRLDSEGTLVNSAGQPLLGESGPINVTKGAFVVDPDGTVHSGADTQDKIRIVQLADNAALIANGDGSYGVSGEMQPAELSASRVRQGFLESSNVQPVTEMLQLMETMRSFETAQRFARGYDDMMDKAITQLGKV